MKQALKIELQEIDEDHDGYKAKKKVARAFIARVDREERDDIKNRVVKITPSMENLETVKTYRNIIKDLKEKRVQGLVILFIKKK